MPRPLSIILLLSAGLAFCARAALPTDDPALAADLKAYIASLDATKPGDCIGFVNRHLSDILYRRFTPASALEGELARMKSAPFDGLPQEPHAQRPLQGGNPQARGGRTASPWWERSGWATREKQSLLRRPAGASPKEAKEKDTGKASPAPACDPRPAASASGDPSGTRVGAT